jgi:hypothetical protein
MVNYLRYDNSRGRTSYSNLMTQAQLPAGTINIMSYYGDGKRRQYQDSATGRIFLLGRREHRPPDRSGRGHQPPLHPQAYGRSLP